MKKTALSFLLIVSFVFIQAQTNLIIEAPLIGATTQSTSTTAYPVGINANSNLVACHFIPQSDLATLTGTSITSFGLKYKQGANVSVSGTFTVYLMNTNNTSYAALGTSSTSWSGIISNMTMVYNGNLTVPAGTGSVNVDLSLSQPFNYTGGGLYVAFAWLRSSTAASTGAYYYYNNVGTVNGRLYATTNTTVTPNDFLNTQTNFRPIFRFGFQNTATNEAAVVDISGIMGTVSEALKDSQVVIAKVKSISAVPLTNFSVMLSVSNANSFNNTQIISSIAPGATETVTFAPFACDATGQNQISVSILPDQNNSNNLMTRTQSVVCNSFGYHSGLTQGSSINNFGFVNNGGVFVGKYSINSIPYAKLSGVKLFVPNGYSNDQKPLCGILLDAYGNTMATTNTITMIYGAISGFQTFTFTSEQDLYQGEEYYIGYAQIEPGYYPMTAVYNDPLYTPGHFFTRSYVDGGGTPNPDNSGSRYYLIEPVVAAPALIIQPADYVEICYGENITLSAEGAVSYTWASSTIFNPVDDPNNSYIFVAPTSNEIYSVVAADDAGCKVSASIAVAVYLCLETQENLSVNREINAYPNPSVNGKTVITGLEGINTIEVYNILGAIVWREKTNSEAVSIDISNQPTGNYIVRISDGNTYSKTIKLINQN